ncbi:MAG: hypothetical protein SF123_13230 [Chloroflexota bacterium]|nr:hypothetical protein [Chloroflexota bacterium]
MRTTLPDEIKDSLRKEIITVHQDAMVRHWLDFGHLDRWVAVTDVNYDDIRQMQHACEQAGLLTVR